MPLPRLASSLALCLAATTAQSASHDALLNAINLPDGFEISVFAEMPKPRSIEIDPDTGTIYVGSRQGHIYALRDGDGDGRAEQVQKIADGLNVPNGIAIHQGRFYIALKDRLVHLPMPDANDQSGAVSVHDDFNNRSHHGWRYLDFGPDGKAYVALGAPCNICELKENTGKIIRMNPDGSDVEIVADGVRNSVGFDWHPSTGQLWFTDNGADNMGDDLPADELNRVSVVGEHFGFPYRGGKDTPLTGYKGKIPPHPVTGAEVEFQAHTANLGIDFYTGNMFPPDYRNDAIVAQHGSWNRSEKVGYRLMRIRFDPSGNAIGKEVFADGWLRNGDVLGRVVDIEELPDGSILVSDDSANLIYRISYKP